MRNLHQLVLTGMLYLRLRKMPCFAVLTDNGGSAFEQQLKRR
jgi:hypothetical protein